MKTTESKQSKDNMSGAKHGKQVREGNKQEVTNRKRERQKLAQHKRRKAKRWERNCKTQAAEIEKEARATKGKSKGRETR